jgi:hypothetical protein
MARDVAFLAISLAGCDHGKGEDEEGGGYDSP